MTDVPFLYVHCDIPAGQPLHAARIPVPRDRFIVRMVARVGRKRIAFFTPRTPTRRR